MVDGLLTGAPDSATITLSYTRGLSDTGQRQDLVNADVEVEDSSGMSYPLTSTGNGVYTSLLNLKAGKDYRLRIHSPDNREYLSDFVPYKITPVIDQVNWKEDSSAVSISLGTHDDSGNTRYYRWSYTETWQYHTYLKTNFDYVNDSVVFREDKDQVYNCWIDHASPNTLLASTENLSRDLVENQEIETILKTTEKIFLAYGIQIRQYALTREGFTYWSVLRQTTESNGSIFDVQPSTFPGNLHCLSNPDEPVIGFISASSITGSRIYIARKQLADYHYTPFYLECSDATVAQQAIARDDSSRIYEYLLMPKHLFTLYYADPLALHVAENYCIDCRFHGGTNLRPSDWPF